MPVATAGMLLRCQPHVPQAPFGWVHWHMSTCVRKVHPRRNQVIPGQQILTLLFTAVVSAIML